MLLMLAAIVIAAMLAVGFFNGANDVSKSIATLVGSGVTRYRVAIVWGSVWTFAGAAAAALAAQGLVAAFSGKGFLTATPDGSGFILAVAIGALAWIWLATATGMPVSTTHALTGGLVGAGVVAAGVGGVQWPVLVGKFALPLAASPIMSTALVFVFFPLVRAGLGRWQDYCVCVQQPAAMAAATTNGVAMNLNASASGVVVNQTEFCECSPVTLAGVTVMDSLHWLSAGATAFARGLNDAPKILGLGAVAAGTLDVPLSTAFMLVAVAMTAGSVMRGFKVTETLAEKVTPMQPIEGLTANLVTAILVIFASRFALPVSTTHVSSAAIVGLGLKRDARAVRWKTVGEMMLAWVVTLPTAAAISALAFYFLRLTTP
ncbi:MAG: inorganic phosphate transporter [Verrucomicrobia bacterium]|nr:inorganic phosphate transporter [Verrucomicrobiota bacterium]